MSNKKKSKQTSKNNNIQKIDVKKLDTSKSMLILLVFSLITMIFGRLTIKNEYIDVLKVFASLFIFGLSTFPLTYKLSKVFKDKGYFLSKTIGILICTFLIFVLGTFKILKFTTLNIWLVILAIALLNYLLIFPKIRKEITKEELLIFVTEEVILLFLLTIFSYVRGFKPEIEQTEKYMDYGIIMSIYKTDFFPIEDMWFSGRNLNYYYFGQVILATILKLFKTKVQTGYNVCLSTIIALSSINLGALIFNIGTRNGKSIKNSTIFGVLTSIATFFTASCHYLYYGVIKYIWDKSYIVYDSTRYIGYNPETNDKTIHEFPIYGFLLGDAHAYTINTIFVIGILSIAFIYYFKEHKNLKSKLLSPIVLLMGFFIGTFRMSNFWDFPIYLVVCSCILFARNIKETIWFKKEFFKETLITVIQLVEMYIVSAIIAIPFTINFKMISSEIKLAKNHSLPHQLFVLWGFFAIVFIIFLIKTIIQRKKTEKNILSLDFVFILLAICGLGLVFLTEVIYVKDIYENSGYARANTMFKLTYQAYILLSIAVSYFIYRFLECKEKIYVAIAIIAIIILGINSTYTGRYLKKDYGNIFDYKGYKCLDGSRYLTTSSSDEYKAINFINTSIEGRHKILEANTDSYSTGNKISSFTGNITIYGWATHEGLWNNYEESEERYNVVAKIYTGTDRDETIRELKKYGIEYIFIGPSEKNKFNDINFSLLESLGTKVFENANTELIKINTN